MTEVSIRPRTEIPDEYTWNAPSVFASHAHWEAELNRLSSSLGEVSQFKGRLGENSGRLLEVFETLDAYARRAERVVMYATMLWAVDTTNQESAGMMGRAEGFFAQYRAAIAYIGPELLAIGRERLQEWMKEEPRLSVYAHYIENLFRKREHVRSAEVEEVLGLLNEPFGNTENTATMLTNADFQFQPARSSQGEELPLSEGTIELLQADKDRETRRTAWENYTGLYLSFKNTLASNLATSFKQNVFSMRARGYPSTLEASLHENNIPVQVFQNLIDVFRKNLPTWHRYWALRRKALGVETLHPYDIWAPLTGRPPKLSYEETVELICRGLEPMGSEYVETVRQGCLQDRWVDVFPNLGKMAGAFSYGRPGSHPFILMSYDDTIFSLSTLAHELGHSMHSYHIWRNQPMIYSSTSLFVAEVASNFHQAMVRAYLLENTTDRDFLISVIEEAMSNFHRYFFIMPTLARFELETHRRVERGESLSAEVMIDLMADLFEEAYGGEMFVDRPRVGITWATFSHLYNDYYVYQYATGISGAHAIANRILSEFRGRPKGVSSQGISAPVKAAPVKAAPMKAAQDYINFLKAGDSLYPLEALKLAGVDLAAPQPVEETFENLAGLVDRLESLLD